MNFNKNILKIDCNKTMESTCTFIQEQKSSLKRDGIVIGLSGGVDSALVASLCVETLGKEKVLGLILPEKDSNVVSAKYAKKDAERLGIETKTIDVTPKLNVIGTYKKMNKIIKGIFPDYNNNCKFKITLPSDLLKKDSYNVFKLTIEDSKGNIKSTRLNIKDLRGIVAATSTKQRIRMLHLYYYAELNNYIVCGTTNRSEFMQGYFVKYGDGGVDIEPLAHLYKVQVYQLANHMKIINEILNRKPSPDTFSFEVSDEEFYIRIPYQKLDILLYAWENNISISEICEIMSLTENQVRRVFRDITSKYNATKHLRQMPPTISNEI